MLNHAAAITNLKSFRKGVSPERFIYLHQSLSNNTFRHHHCSGRSYVRNAPPLLT